MTRPEIDAMTERLKNLQLQNTPSVQSPTMSDGETQLLEKCHEILKKLDRIDATLDAKDAKWDARTREHRQLAGAHQDVDTA